MKSEEKTEFDWLLLSLFHSHSVFVPGAGIEPALPKELDFESSASTSSATRALIFAMPGGGVYPDLFRGHAGKGSAKLTIQGYCTKKKSKHI